MNRNKLGFGLMRLPLTDPADQASINFPVLNEMVDLFFEKGGTYFDTGYPYHNGMSEVAFREAVVKRHPRDSFTITDKMPLMYIQEASQYSTFFQEQLERCGVDYFDYYFLHAIGQLNYSAVQQMNGFDFLKQKKAEGKIRHIGFSYHDNAALLEKVLTDYPETELVQLQINYIDWEDAGIEARKCYEVCCQHGVKVSVMEPLKGGALTRLPQEAGKRLTEYHPDMSLASWGIRFAASLEQVMVVLSGMSSLEQMQDNLSYMENFKPLDSEEEKILFQTVDTIKAKIEIPCTGCRYCVDGCPKHIAIPESFAFYNDLKLNGGGGGIVRYANLVRANGRAADCIGCGECERRCPQHLTIREYLKRVAEAENQDHVRMVFEFWGQK